MSKLAPFHLAIPVQNLSACRQFYREVLGFTEGRSDQDWVDFNFYGHQVVLHHSPQKQVRHFNPVDGDAVPVPHFGVVLSMDAWKKLADQLEMQNLDFIIDPTIRFKCEPGEQATLFFEDPDGNALEFKAFQNPEQLFAT